MRHEESMWSPQAESSRIGMAHTMGAPHRLGLHYTAKAMDIVTRGGGFWSPYAEVAIAVAGACGWSTWSYRSWHHLVFRRLCGGQGPCRGGGRTTPVQAV